MAEERRSEKPEPTTVSYLLRVWRVRGEEGFVLRAALKSSHDAEWVGFASLEALVAALRAETGQEEPMANGRPQAENDAGHLAAGEQKGGDMQRRGIGP